MMGREVFLMKPKHQCHLSQWGEYVYGAQSQKKSRLLCASMFVTIDERAVIPKKWCKEKLFI